MTSAEFLPEISMRSIVDLIALTRAHYLPERNEVGKLVAAVILTWAEALTV
jgi:hypothetical protein